MQVKSAKNAVVIICSPHKKAVILHSILIFFPKPERTTLENHLYTMKTIKLSNGVEMPLLGYGVFQVPPQEAERCVNDALSVGYRLIDTAQAYYNEEGVGAAVAKSGIDRKDLFLVTKVWVSNNGEERAAKSIDESLHKLQTDYIDLLLIHQAYGDVFGTWRAMEKAYKTGKVRAIGVSNFQAARFFDFAHYVDIKPMVNQLQCNTMVQQNDIQPVLAEHDTKMMAWGPFAGWNQQLGSYKKNQQGQADIYRDVIAWGKEHGLIGIRYWAPDYEGEWYPMSMFTFENKVGTAKTILLNHKEIVQ